MGIITTIVLATMAIASAGIAAYGQYQAGQQAKAAGEYNAAVARNNATQAEAWASYNADQERRKRLAARETMISSYAKSGVVLDEDGTPGYVLNEQLVQDELAVQTILRSAKSQAASLRSQADMYSIEGKNAATAGTLAAVSTGLKGISSAASIASAGGGGAAGGTTGSTASTAGTSTASSNNYSLASSPYYPGKV